MASHIRDAADRRHLLDLAEGYARAADQIVPASSEGDNVDWIKDSAGN